MNDQFTLTKDETHSALWLKLREHLESKLDFYRRKNDGDHNDIETALIRGRISVLKNLLELDQPDRHQDAEYGFEDSNAAPPV